MTEIGRIHPLKKAACPHCGHILPDDPESYRKKKNSICPKCKRPISQAEAASAAPPSVSSHAPMSFNAQMLKMQFQNKTAAQNSHKPGEESGKKSSMDS
ncbi:MAG: hypothetical protein V2A78_10140 [bacterium]